MYIDLCLFRVRSLVSSLSVVLFRSQNVSLRIAIYRCVHFCLVMYILLSRSLSLSLVACLSFSNCLIFSRSLYLFCSLSISLFPNCRLRISRCARYLYSVIFSRCVDMPLSSLIVLSCAIICCLLSFVLLVLFLRIGLFLYVHISRYL